jgi:hypothetical protein
MNNEEKLVYLYKYLDKKYSVYPMNSPLGFSIEYHLTGFPHVFSLGKVQISNGNLYLQIERFTGNLLLNVAKRMHLERVVTESDSCIFKVGKPRTLKERIIFWFNWFKRSKHETQENSSDNYYG